MPEEVELITPSQAREWRDLSGLTLKELSRRSNVSISRMCEYMRGTLPLKPDQKRAIENALKAEIVERARRIAVIAGEAPPRKLARRLPSNRKIQCKLKGCEVN